MIILLFLIIAIIGTLVFILWAMWEFKSLFKKPRILIIGTAPSKLSVEELKRLWNETPITVVNDKEPEPADYLPTKLK